MLFSQRARLIEGVVLAVAEKGYTATRVQDITKAARVSRTTFYEQFADKEDCFLEAYRAGSDAHLHHVEDALRRSSGWPRIALEGVRANLEGLAARPAYAKALLIEVHAAGPRLLAAREDTHERYAALLSEMQVRARKVVPDVPELPPEVFKAAVAAADEVVVAYMREGKGDRLLELTGTIAYIHLSLAGLPELALQALASEQPAERPARRGAGTRRTRGAA